MSELRTPSESYTEQVQILTQNTMNGRGRLFGGHLMEWIDMVAVVAARRHCRRNVTTASVERLEFRQPAMADSLIVLAAKPVYTGRTSIQICVRSYVESLDGSRRLINVAYLTLVALDDEDRPCEVPALLPETEEEKREFEAGRRRAKESKSKRVEAYL